MLTNLYDIAEENDIIVVDIRMQKLVAASVMDEDGDCMIGIDNRKLTSRSEYASILGHELGHCMTGSFYCRYTPYDIRSKQEYRADKWAIQTLLPMEELKSAFKSGVCEVWQLAERFDVTEELVRKALWIYFDIDV